MTSPAGAATSRRLLRLYPRRWRARYEEEVLALLEVRPPGRRESIDLVRGAIDAHLHPESPSLVPSLAALLAGAAWTVVTVAIVVEPTPPDWPGQLAWTLGPSIVGTVAGLVASLAVALRIGEASPGAGRLAIGFLLIGHAAWVVALVMAMMGGPYGAVTGAAGTTAALSLVGIGLAAMRVGDHPPGEALVLVGVGLMLPPPVAWLVAAGTWTALGLWGLVARATTLSPPTIGA